jgi:hypothetical protein
VLRVAEKPPFETGTSSSGVMPKFRSRMRTRKLLYSALDQASEWLPFDRLLLCKRELTGCTFHSTSVILSAVEFPERLHEDAQTLPPIRLPDLEIVMQSAASGMVPTKKLALLSTLVKGRIWIYRPIGWDYVGLNLEPSAEWPPPDPTLFLPS